MALQVEKQIPLTEDAFQPVGEWSDFFTSDETTSERTSRTAGEADEAVAMVLEVLECNAAFAFGGIFRRAVWLFSDYAELRICKQAAEVLVSRAVRNQQVEPRFILEGDVCRDDRFDAGGDCRLVKAGLSVDTVAIPECDCIVADFGRLSGQIFWKRSAFEKAERAA